MFSIYRAQLRVLCKDFHTLKIFVLLCRSVPRDSNGIFSELLVNGICRGGVFICTV